jgi:hypothetical protein
VVCFDLGLQISRVSLFTKKVLTLEAHHFMR